MNIRSRTFATTVSMLLVLVCGCSSQPDAIPAGGDDRVEGDSELHGDADDSGDTDSGGDTVVGCNPPCGLGDVCIDGDCVAGDEACGILNPVGLCPLNQGCLDGTCVDSAQLCGSENLEGDCPSGSGCRNGQCLDDDQACSLDHVHGFCTPLNETCLNGSCVLTSSLCSAANPTGACEPGSSSLECIDGSCRVEGALCGGAEGDDPFGPPGSCPTANQACLNGECIEPGELCTPSNPTGLCLVGRRCLGGACVDDGITCDSPESCESGFCVDGICCEEACGACSRCDGLGAQGTCTPVPDGKNWGECQESELCLQGACRTVLGESCEGDDTCFDGACTDGVCCQTSTCPTCQSCGAEGACFDDETGTNPGDECVEPAACREGECRDPNGVECESGDSCLSGVCDDGVCCEATCGTCQACDQADQLGTCVDVADGEAPEGDCSEQQACFGGACKLLQGQGCSTGDQCSTDVCDDGVCCEAQCGECDFCNIAGSAGSCVTVPDGNDPGFDCTDPALCFDGSCKLPQGESCSPGDACETGTCEDGVCCDSTCGPCEACNVGASTGTCVDAFEGQQDACAANQICASGECVKLDGQGCLENDECASGICTDGVCCEETCGNCERCDLNGLGTCETVPNETDPSGDCAPFGVCVGIECKTSDGRPCNDDNECLSGDCGPVGVCLKSLGVDCSGDSSCASDHCVDGVCCNQSCGGSCARCDAPGEEGTCTATCANPADCCCLDFSASAYSCGEIADSTCDVCTAY